MVAPREPNEVKNEKIQAIKMYLTDQMKERKQAKKDGDGKFFGMTDEEILMNKDVF